MDYYLFDVTQRARAANATPSRSGCLRRILTLPGRILLGLISIALTVGIVLAFVNPLQVLLNGAATDGEYVNRHIGQPNGARFITYSYKVDGIVYTATSNAYGDWYDRAPTRILLPVLYARHNPQISVLESVNLFQVMCMGILSVGIVLGGIGSLFAPLDEPHQIPRRIIPGRLVEITPQQMPNGTLWRIQYKFRSPRTRKQIQGHFASQRYGDSGLWIPPPNAKLAIEYMDDSIHHPL
jgi:hypothetical protein